MRTTPAIEDVVTQIVARDITAGVELARSLGYTMPTDFNIGVRFIHERDVTRIRMRLNDVAHDAIVRLPDLSIRHGRHRQSLATSSQMWVDAWERIHADALTVAHVWIDKHPDAKASLGVRALALLDAMQSDALMAGWMNSCRERSKHFKYTRLR